MILTQNAKDNGWEGGTYEVLRHESILGPTGDIVNRAAALCKFRNAADGEEELRILIMDTMEGVGGRVVVDWSGYVQLVHLLNRWWVDRDFIKTGVEKLYDDIVSGDQPLTELAYTWMDLKVGTMDESAEGGLGLPEKGDVLLIDYQGLMAARRITVPDRITILDFFDAETPEDSRIPSPHCRVALCDWERHNTGRPDNTHIICGFEINYGIGGRLVPSDPLIYLSSVPSFQFTFRKGDLSVPDFLVAYEYEMERGDSITEGIKPERAILRNGHFYCPCQMGLKGKHRKIQKFLFARPVIGIGGRLSGWEFGTAPGIQRYYGCINCGRVVEAKPPHNVIGNIRDL